MDIFVSSSKEGSETYGIAVLEALASGLRVVAVDCPVLDGLQVNGVSWTAQDVLQLRRVLLDERARGACSGKFDEILRQHYDICNIAATIDDLYEALLDSR
jgi:glycosyltransferase involved in cell wall biosynthesis